MRIFTKYLLPFPHPNPPYTQSNLPFDRVLFTIGYITLDLPSILFKYIYYKSLKELIENLPNEFMRVHNSYIVNLTNIDSFEDNHIILKGTKISVAKSYKECLNSTINKFML